MSEAAPALKQDQPVVPMLSEAVELAEHVKPSWPALKKQNVGRLVCEGEEEGIGTPAPEAPEANAPDTSQEGDEESFPDFDFDGIPEDLREKAERYAQEVKSHFQAPFTKKAQEAAEVRREAEQARQLQEALRNPQVAPAVLAQLGHDEKAVLGMYGYETDEEPEFEEDDPDERIGRLEQALSEREQAERQTQQEEAVSDYIAERIEALEGKEKREFDAEEHQLLDLYARSNPTPEGHPDVEGAFKLLSGIVSSRQKAMLDPKRNAPRPAGGGRPGSQMVDLSKESQEDRVARMAQAADEARGSVAA